MGRRARRAKRPARRGFNLLKTAAARIYGFNWLKRVWQIRACTIIYTSKGPKQISGKQSSLEQVKESVQKVTTFEQLLEDKLAQRIQQKRYGYSRYKGAKDITAQTSIKQSLRIRCNIRWEPSKSRRPSCRKAGDPHRKPNCTILHKRGDHRNHVTAFSQTENAAAATQRGEKQQFQNSPHGGQWHSRYMPPGDIYIGSIPATRRWPLPGGSSPFIAFHRFSSPFILSGRFYCPRHKVQHTMDPKPKALCFPLSVLLCIAMLSIATLSSILPFVLHVLCSPERWWSPAQMTQCRFFRSKTESLEKHLKAWTARFAQRVNMGRWHLIQK